VDGGPGHERQRDRIAPKDAQALAAADRARRRERAYTRMYRCRAHDSIADVIPCLDDIEARIARGERP